MPLRASVVRPSCVSRASGRQRSSFKTVISTPFSGVFFRPCVRPIRVQTGFHLRTGVRQARAGESASARSRPPRRMERNPRYKTKGATGPRRFPGGNRFRKGAGTQMPFDEFNGWLASERKKRPSGALFLYTALTSEKRLQTQICGSD